jgi:hypothetical protein
MANLTLRITLQTTNDDLRGGSWADLILKLRTSPALRERLQFTGTGGLAGGSVRVFDVTFAVPDSFQPTDIEYFQIRHVSQESLPLITGISAAPRSTSCRPPDRSPASAGPVPIASMAATGC